MISVITSKNNEKVKYAFSLRLAKNRKQEGKFIGEGKKALELALQAGVVEQIFTYEALDIPEEIPQFLVNEEVMEKLSNMSSPEGVVFVAKIPEFKKDNLNKILFLDGVNDPGNLGTLVRTALSFDYDAVILGEETVSIYNEKALASCKGANYLIPVFNGSLVDYKDGYQIIVSTLSDKSINPEEVKLEDKFVLVLGNEARGVSKKSESLADSLVKIPMANINSLNVSVAGGILMYILH